MSYKIHPTVREAVEGARERQIHKFGDTATHDIHLDAGAWSMITGEEFGEWCKAMLQERTDDWDKAADLAACAIAFMEASLHKAANS